MLRRLLAALVALGCLSGVAAAALIVPEVRAVTTANATTNTRTVARPTGCQAGDAALVGIRFGAGVVEATSESGFTQLTPPTLQGGIKAYIYYRFLTDADLAVASWTWTYTGTADVVNHKTACIAGADPGTAPIVSTVSQGSSTTPLANSVTTTAANSMLLYFAMQGGSGTYTPPSGMAEQADANGATIATEIIAVAGATGTRTATSTVSQNWVSWNVALKPALGRRFYLDETNDAAGRPTPGFAAIWDQTASTTERQFLDVKPADTTPVDFSVAETSTTNNWDVSILRYWIRLGTGSISGTFNAQIGAAESNASLNAEPQVTVEVYSNSGSLVGTPFAGDTDTSFLTTEFGAAGSVNRAFPANGVPGTAQALRELTTIAHSNGDWLCVTFGYRAVNTAATNWNATLRAKIFATDFNYDLTVSGGTNGPWLQITGPVALYNPVTQPPMRTLLGAGPKAAAGGIE